LRGGKTASLLLALATATAVGTTTSAHRRDEHLMAARLAIEPGGVDLELDMTPGIAVAEATIAQIDRNHDGVLSADEQRAYVDHVLDAVVLELDGRLLHVQHTEWTFPGLDAIRLGEGTIQLHSTVPLPRHAAGDHQLAFRNNYSPDASVYLANALLPVSDRVDVRTQHRDASQRTLTIDYALRPASSWLASAWAIWFLAAAAIVLLVRSVLCVVPPFSFEKPFHRLGHGLKDR
jgi:hypothetical protein